MNFNVNDLTQGLDIPGNAFSQQQFLDLYGGGGDENGNALDWSADMMKLLNFPPFPPHQLHSPAHLPPAPHMQSAASQLPSLGGLLPPSPYGVPANTGYLGLSGTETLLQHARHQSVSGNQTHSRSMSVQGSPGIMSPGQGGSYMLTPTTAGRKLSTQKSNDTAEKEVAKGTKRKAVARKSKGDAKDGQSGKEKQFYNYYHSTYSIRQYLTDHLSDQQVDDLEEMAKCIYEAQLEALLPLDYKDLCFLEEVVGRQAQFYESFLDLVGTPGAVWRRTGDILCCNDNFAGLLTMSKEELLSGNIVKLAAPEALYDAVKIYTLRLLLPGLPRQLVSDTALLRRVDNQRLYCRVLVTVVQNTYHMPSVVLGLFFPYPSPAAEHENILVLP